MRRLLVNGILSGLVAGVTTFQSMGIDTPVTIVTLGVPVFVGIALNLAGLFQRQPKRND